MGFALAYTPKAKVRPNKDGLFLPYQEHWIKDESRIKAAEKSRQIGWTWCSAYRLVRTTSIQGAGFDAWVSSRDDIQARLFLEDCKAFSKLLQMGAKDLGEKVYEDANGKPFTAYTLEFSNGRKIYSMSSNPDAQAGKRGTRVLDEFALHPDPRELYSIAYPGITWGGNLEIFSTHRGSDNFFNKEIIEHAKGANTKGISLHRVTLQDALDQGFLYKLQDKLVRFTKDDERLDMDESEYFNYVRNGCADEESFLQEYMCVPADDAAAFLSYDMIASCEYAEGLDWELEPTQWKNPMFIGVDIGRNHDLTVIWVLESIAGKLFTRKVVELKDVPFSQQEEILYPLIANPFTRRCCIDSTGLGKQFAERAKDRFGYKVEEVSFTLSVKEELAYPLRSQFEDRSIVIPKKNYIRADLRSIKKETTAAGNIRFTADHGKNGHADRFWAAALAVNAAKSPKELRLPPLPKNATAPKRGDAREMHAA